MIDVGSPYFLFMEDEDRESKLEAAARDIANYPGFRNSHNMDFSVTRRILNKHGLNANLSKHEQEKLISMIKKFL